MAQSIQEQIDALLVEINEWETERDKSPPSIPHELERWGRMSNAIDSAIRCIGCLLYEQLSDGIDINDTSVLIAKSEYCDMMAAVHKHGNRWAMSRAMRHAEQRFDSKIKKQQALVEPQFLTIVNDIILYIEVLICKASDLRRIIQRLENLPSSERAVNEHYINEIQLFSTGMFTHNYKELLLSYCKTIRDNTVWHCSDVLQLARLMILRRPSITMSYLGDVMRRISQTDETNEAVRIIQEIIRNSGDTRIVSSKSCERIRKAIEDLGKRTALQDAKHDVYGFVQDSYKGVTRALASHEETIKRDTPTKLANEDPFAKYLYEMLANLSSFGLTSRLNVVVQEYFEYVTMLLDVNAELYLPITGEIQGMFEKHGWSTISPTGFRSEPNQKSLVECLHAIVDKYT
jgi:hypothetical protein